MKREIRSVYYSYEHGDESLPHLKDLVSEEPDPMKSKIIGYLRTHCVAACPGIIQDEINPDQVIGCGNMYSDGTYIWRDVFCNYVDRYNIPVPEEFRNHILENYDERMKRHFLLRLIDRVDIHNNPYLGFTYDVSIERTGVIHYKNNTDCKDGALLKIKSDDAKYIINPIMSELFCYDSDDHGYSVIDGHYWKLTFFKQDKVIDEIEGRTHEDPWRYNQIKRVLEFAERYIPKDLGSNFMNEDE